MKKMLVIVGILLSMGLFAGEAVKLDPVQRKYKSKLAQIEKRYQADKAKINKLMIRDYQLLLKQKTRTADLKGANAVQAKINTLNGAETSSEELVVNRDNTVSVVKLGKKLNRKPIEIVPTIRQWQEVRVRLIKNQKILYFSTFFQ